MTKLRNHTPRADSKSRCRGAALVEMALILPFLIVMVLVCVDFGRFATSYTAVTNAAREGANFGGTHPFTDTTFELWKQQVTKAAKDEMAGIPGFSAEQLTVAEPLVIASQTRARVRVEVDYTFKPAILWPALLSELKISRSAEMPVIR